jgi:hypothetical protein
VTAAANGRKISLNREAQDSSMKNATALIPGLAVIFWLTGNGVRAEELAGGTAPFQVIEISPAECDYLASHVPTSEADYKPGIATDGQAVAPADLDGGYGVGMRPFYEFDVRILPLGATGRFGAATDMSVAHVVVDAKTGRITIDGEDVTGADHALAEACAELHRKAPGPR